MCLTLPASLYGVEIPSILLQIIIYARIKFYKMSSISNSRIKTYLLTYIDSTSFTSFILNMIAVLIVILIFGINVFSSIQPPERLVLFPYSLLFYYSILIFPSFLHFLLIGSIFLKNPQMRICIWREVQNALEKLTEKITFKC